MNLLIFATIHPERQKVFTLYIKEILKSGNGKNSLGLIDIKEQTIRMYISGTNLVIKKTKQNTIRSLLRTCRSAYSLLSFQNVIDFCLIQASNLRKKDIHFSPIIKVSSPLVLSLGYTSSNTWFPVIH